MSTDAEKRMAYTVAWAEAIDGLVKSGVAHELWVRWTDDSHTDIEFMARNALYYPPDDDDWVMFGTVDDTSVMGDGWTFTEDRWERTDEDMHYFADCFGGDEGVCSAYDALKERDEERDSWDE